MSASFHMSGKVDYCSNALKIKVTGSISHCVPSIKSQIGVQPGPTALSQLIFRS